jgi:hypothetical protein
MGEIDFWNLAGRAGRSGKEFQGNVICIDPYNEDVWSGSPPREKKKYKIEKTVDKVIDDTESLIEYIKAGTPRIQVGENQELEHGFVYLVGEHLRCKGLNKSPYVKKHDQRIIGELESVIGEVLESIEIPKEIILRNPGISPIAQQNLLEFFHQQEDELESFIPTLPGSPNAFGRYLKMIDIISKFLSGDHPGSTYPYTRLILEWMTGKPLAVSINRNWKYWRRRGNKGLSTVIRDTMRDIEEYARFKFVKYSSCYIDILKYHLSQTNKPELVKRIPELNLWLEFGASQDTQVSLMSLGLTRTTAIALSDFMDDLNYSRKECIQWLIKKDLRSLKLSTIMLNEIEKVVGFYKNKV